MILLNMVTLTDFKQDISDSLMKSDLVEKFSFNKIDEHSDQQLGSLSMSKRDLVVGYTEKIKLEILVPEDRLNEIKSLLKEIKGLDTNSYLWTIEIKNLKL